MFDLYVTLSVCRQDSQHMGHGLEFSLHRNIEQFWLGNVHIFDVRGSSFELWKNDKIMTNPHSIP